MKRTALSSMSVLFTLSLVSCIPYQTYDGVKHDLDVSKKSLEDLEVKYNRVIQELDSGSEGDSNNLQSLLRSKEDEMSLLKARLEDLENNPTIRFPEDITQKIPGTEIGQGGQLILGEAVLFNQGSSTLKNEGVSTLFKLADLFKSEYSDVIFHFVGHPDNVPLAKTR